ncbi:membrane protein [Microbacterium phage Honk]|uniref:Membrane protein n=1 Tax=Microbacterium phage Honk TaxID=2836095 RepID=A0A8F3IMT2_9CAUD|nr:membrane protein [Microbacterium phage Honk]
MLNPDYLPPEVALPVGAILWAIVLVPPTARYLRARRADRKAR